MIIYDPSPNPLVLSQGDIIRNFIFPDPPDDVFLVRKPPPASTAPEEHTVGDPATTRSIIRQGTVTDAFADGKEAIVVDAILTNVAVISQSCDIDRKAFLAVATVIPIISIANRDKEDSVRASKMGGTYWLPEQPGILLESYIDLSLIFSVRRENLVARIGDRILGLSILARQKLQWTIVNHFGRPADE